MSEKAKDTVVPLEDTEEVDAPYLAVNQDTVGFFSRQTFSYVSTMLVEAKRKMTTEKKPMLLGDCFHLAKAETIEVAVSRFNIVIAQELLRCEKLKIPLSVPRVLWKAYPRELYFGAMYRLLSDACVFVSPIILRLIINFLKSTDAPVYEGFVWVGILSLCNFFFALFQNSQLSCSGRFALLSRNALMSATFEHTLHQGVVASSGNLIQLHSTDCSKIIEAALFMHTIWAAPLLVVVFVGQLYFYVGWAGIVGFGVMCLTVPTSTALSRKMMLMKTANLKHTVTRVQSTNEALQGIRICKFMSWEDSFVKRIDDRRRVEHAAMYAQSLYRVWFRSLQMVAPMLVTFVVFTIYVKTEPNGLESGAVFPALAVLNGIRMPMMMFAMTMGRLVDTLAAVERVGAYLQTPKMKSNVTYNAKITSEDIVVMKSASMQYRGVKKAPEAKKPEGGRGGGRGVDKPAPKPEGDLPIRVVLRDASVTIKKGSLTLVVGPTGCGKTTFLHGLLGEGGVEVSGGIAVQGRLAYSSQEAWIMNTTLRNNIIMGITFDEEKYKDVVRVCQLTADLEQLPNGDRTEIGEKGINLSGGQKQRVSLARAVYCDADVYILDDPLSAVDAHVSHALMHECFLKHLSEKTRILVTHQTQYTPFANNIVTMEDGKLTFRSVEDVLPAEASQKHHDEEDPTEVATAPESSPESKAAAGRLMKKEKTEVGEIKWDVFRYYFASAYFRVVFFVFFSFMLFQLGKTLADLWLSWWPERKVTMSNDDYLLWWGITNAGCYILVFARQYILNTAQFISSQRLHESLVKRMILAPTSYYDTTPLGRIMTVFTRDFDIVDNSLPESMSIFLNIFFMVVGSIILICVATPYISIVIAMCGYFYYRLHGFYSVATRGIKRLDGVYRAPVLSLMNETITGLTSIRACGLASWISAEHTRRLGDSARPYFNQMLVTRWLFSRLEFIGTTVVMVTALLAVIQKVTAKNGDVNVSVLGLAIVYALGITQFMNGMTRNAGEIEAAMNSIERIKMAAQETPQEKEVEYTNEPTSLSPHPHPSWPSSGALLFNEVNLRYRDNLPLVLKGVTCSIPSGSRVGIVGRTGSGKSTMLLALFRIVELAGGSISLDGRDIATLKMKDLRGKITVIPQDPVLFEGTIRSNLDPFGEHKDEVVWEVLRKVNLEERIKEGKGGLRSTVAERGSNFSVGQRQLICMARALLKNCKVLLMDEATASVDNATDALIQRTLRLEFKGCTVLTIAHRLLTVMDSDLIMVMKGGVLVEFDRPKALLEQPEGELTRMVQTHGAEQERLLVAVAEGVVTVITD